MAKTAEEHWADGVKFLASDKGHLRVGGLCLFKGLADDPDFDTQGAAYVVRVALADWQAAGTADEPLQRVAEETLAVLEASGAHERAAGGVRRFFRPRRAEGGR